MSKEPVLEVVVRFSSSKGINPSIGEIQLGSYKIRSIPSIRDSMAYTSEEMLLEFADVWTKNQTFSNPEKEARYILDLLSLLGRSRINFNSIRVNNVNVTFRTSSAYKQFDGYIDLPSDFHDIYNNLFSLDERLFLQFIRSCSAYQNAISLLPDNPTLGCFMLVVAIECLSNVTIEGRNSHFSKFRDFIIKYLPLKIKTEETDMGLFVELLKQIYNSYRSGFTHGGLNISIGSLAADKSGLKYVKHTVDGKEIKSPSLTWFENVVRGVLIEFLRKCEKVGTNVENRRRLVNLAISESVLHVKLLKTKKAGEVVFQGDIDIQ